MSQKIFPITMPKWGIEMQQGTITEWHAAPGGALAKGAPLLDVETEKIVNSVEAPVAGTLIARNVEAGDVVQPGRVLMTLSPHGRTQLVVAIDEKNLALLALGEPALASADAYPTLRFPATLAYINPGVNATTGAVEVKLDVTAPPAVLKQDMTVSVDIEVARRAQALIVPLAAVRDAGGVPWVLRLEGRRAVRRSVQLGLRSDGLAEVLGGLSEGDAVLVGAADVEPGARVRAVPRAAADPAPTASAQDEPAQRDR
jgi:HlyD family secretion protein